MPDRTSRRERPRDTNILAAEIVAEATGEGEPQPEPEADTGKNPAAVALGKLGGKKGGPARAKALSAERRREIAKKAAEVCWGRREQSS